MSFDILHADSCFDLSQANCLIAVIGTSIVIGIICFMVLFRYLRSIKEKKRRIIGVLFRTTLIIVMVVLSDPIERAFASIFATMDMRASGTNGSVGYPFGEAPIWPSALACAIATASAVLLSRKQQNESVT